MIHPASLGDKDLGYIWFKCLGAIEFTTIASLKVYVILMTILGKIKYPKYMNLWYRHQTNDSHLETVK